MHHSLFVLNTIKGAQAGAHMAILSHQRRKGTTGRSAPSPRKKHDSGLLFGHAEDRCTEPDWYVLPDGHLPDAWKLLHAAAVSASDAVPDTPLGKRVMLPIRPKSALNHSIRSIYDAWRWIIELDQPSSPLRLPLRPDLLQKGCYWQRLPESNQESNQGNQRNQGGGPSQDHLSSAIQAEVSLTETSSVDGENNTSPSEAPEPSSRSQQPGSPVFPITIGSTEEEQANLHKNAYRPSASDSHVE